jgi:hypothetical protein
MSESGGNLQIRDAGGNVVEQFGWGSADSALGQPASVSDGGESMYRLYDHMALAMNNTDNNFADFDITTSPTPGMLPAIISEEPDPTPQSYQKLQTTVLPKKALVGV